MRIAQVSPLHESVPPKMYGGTERVVSYLTEELVRQGHDVTLFASGDSRTKAKLVPCWPEALRLNGDCTDKAVPHILMIEQVFSRADQFDIIHLHTDYLHFHLARRSPVASITTLHGRLDQACTTALFREFTEMPLVSISQSQRTPIAWANWKATVHHGLPEHLYRFHREPGKYLAFAGRISEEKRPDLAIEIAQKAGLPLKMAAKVDPADRDYFERNIKHLLDRPGVEFIGEVNDGEKEELLGGALAMLFPIDWPEPFGLVMIEAMACGTPTIAFRRGSVPEIIREGVSGMIVNNVDEAVQAVKRIGDLDRRQCRADFETRFTAERMAREYLEVYRQRIRGQAVTRVGGLHGAIHDIR